jgi:ribosomal protein S18 acetylase RimI-like enzyme
VSALRVRALGPADGAAVATIWNETFAASQPLGPRAWQAWWASPDADPALAWGIQDADGALLGALLARVPRRPWAPPDLAHVALFAVASAARGRGVGDQLWHAATAALRARGRTRVRLGADPERWLPGVPLTAPAATWRFLRARGVRLGGLEADLWLDLDDRALEHTALPEGVRLVDDDRAGAQAFVARIFPGRWADEVARYLASGCTVLTLQRDLAAEPIGFCVAARPTDAVLSPALGWTGEPWGPPDPGVAGLGPLGIDPAARGGGLGLAMVAAAARWQGARGHRAVVIDWTTLTDFYGRLGARAWRVYQRAEGEL